MRRAAWIAVVTALASALAGCASRPPAPDWQAKAHTAMERTLAAYLNGQPVVEAQEFDRARSEIARTGRADLMARAELMFCAAHVASLDFGVCDGFERLRGDAAAPEVAYADYLAARLDATDAARLPEQHHAVASASGNPTGAVQAIADPLARLVAAGVLLRAGRADPALLDIAVDTASAQGWRRPLLAWLGVQRQRAEQAGASAEAARLQRRIELVGAHGSAASPPADAPVSPAASR